MPITPLDIRKKSFSPGLRGFSAREVKAFLELVAKEMEELRKERGMLVEKVDEQHAQLETFQRTESLLKETLVTAQKTTGEMKEATEQRIRAMLAEAEQDARGRIAEAEKQAAEIIAEARQNLEKLRSDIKQLEARQSSLLDQVRAVGHACETLADRWGKESPAEPNDAPGAD